MADQYHGPYILVLMLLQPTCLVMGGAHSVDPTMPCLNAGKCDHTVTSITECPKGGRCWIEQNQSETLHIDIMDLEECERVEPASGKFRKLSITVRVPGWPLCHLCNYASAQEIEWQGDSGNVMNFTWSCLPQLRIILIQGMNITDLQGQFLQGLGGVTEIALRDNKIHFINESALAQCLDLRCIDLSQNNLLSLHADVFVNNTNLEKINISHNALRHFSADIFQATSKLKNLDLESNQMISLSFLVNHSTFDSLETLDVSHNKIETLSGDTFHYLDSLLELDLGYNSIQHIDSSLFRCGLQHLKRLDLAGNKLAALPDNVFQGLNRLVTLNLSHNSLQNLNAAIFERGGSEGNESMICDSQSYYSAEMGYKSDGNDFAKKKAIKDMVFHENSASGVHDKSMVIKQVVNQSWRKFHTLDASHNKINKISPDTFTSQLAYVRNIVLSYNRLQHLPRDSLEHLVYLESINVSHNKINWLDVGAFNNPRLRSIDLSHNRLTKIISMAFLYLPSLQTLDLSYNKINYIYKMAFYRTCKHGQSMKVDLSHNRLQNDGLLKVVNCFRHLQDTACRLTVDLQQNSFTHFFQQPTTNLRVNLQTGDSKYFKTWDHIYFQIAKSSIICDCQMFYDIDLMSKVSELFHKDFVQPENLKFWENMNCSGPGQYENMSLSHFKEKESDTCEEQYGCPSGCDCRPNVDHTDVDCSYRHLSHIPVRLPQGPKILQLQGNQLRVIGDLPTQYKELRSINLSFSNIEYISPSAWQVLSQVKTVWIQGNELNTVPVRAHQACVDEISLGANPLRCGCPNQHLMEWILNCSDTITDFDTIQCADGTFFLDSFNEACVEEQHSSYVTDIILTLISMGITLVIGLLILFVGYKYRHVFTSCCSHKRKWYKVHADECTKHDVFVAYSSMDSDTIMFGLLPMLQRGGQFPSICLQHRDWQSRKTVFTNFNESVQNTNAVIVVLSHNFLQTEFQSDEYRQYMAHLLSCSCVPICIVNLDGVDVEPVFRELCVDCPPAVLLYDKEDFREQLLGSLPRFDDKKYYSSGQENLGGILVECEKY